MRRLPVLTALVVAAIIAASTWLVIDAQTDPQPLPVAEHLPRDDEQAQQQQSQTEPNPDPDEQSEEQESADQEPSDEEASESLSESDESEPVETIRSPQTPADMLIRALEIERPEIEPEAFQPPPPAFTTYIIEAGDTLADIAAQFELKLDDLIAANELDSPDQLHVGQELTIPLEAATEPDVNEPESIWEPEEVIPSITEDGIVYGTIHDHERGVINTASIALAQSDSTIWLVEACVDGVRRTYIMGLPTSGDQARLYWRFDGGTLNTDLWETHEDRVESIRWCPFLHRLDEVEGTRDLWIRIGGADLTFTIENIVPDEVLANFSYCGR
ncbi:MAG: LysM peptidoglycan-binding domain-containing protein [Chloroflexi bacterium]|nr:LysM peptidoglycan-binding domain-containing protein [Chloroflexota bacterium]